MDIVALLLGLLSFGLIMLVLWAKARRKKPLMWAAAGLAVISGAASLALAYFLATFDVVW